MTTLERASQPGLLDLWRNSRKGRAVLALWVGVAASVSAQAVLQKRRKARKRKESRLQKETNNLEKQHVQPEAKALLSESPKASDADAPQEGKGEAEENKEPVGALNGKGEDVESDDKKQDVRVLLRLLRKDRDTLGLSGLVASAVVLRLLVSIKVSRKIGSLGSLLAQRKWKDLANAQMDFALWTIPAALLNAFVEYAQSLLALAIQKRLLHEVHQRFAEPGGLGRAADTLGDQDQRAASDTARLAEEAATLVQSSFKPLAETLILSATLARLMGIRPLLTCYAYFALAGTWSRMVAPSLTSLQDRVQRDEGAFRGAHSRLKEYVQEVQFARGETVEATRLEDLFRSVARTKTLHGAQRFASGALDGYAVRYMGILAALAMMTPALSDPARNVEDPTEFFLTCLHLLVNLMSAFKDIALAFRALSAVRALASRVNALLVVGHGITHPVTTLARTPAGQAAVERQALEKLSRGEDTGKIIVDRITITASGVEILHKFSCTFQQGESVFIRGHNGAGKTSLLRVLRGMWSPAAGTVTCNVPASALLFMTQRPYFLQGATLREQLLYPQRSGDAIVVDDDVLLEAISRVGLESVVMQPAVSSLDQEFGTDGLSAGEAQRLACARVLVRRPVFCFADECTGSCTEAFETAFFTHCIEDLGITMITVSHRSAVQSLHARVLDLSDTSASHVSPDVEKN